MRVFISGYESSDINKIAVTTFLDGLYANYKDNLYVIHTGIGNISDIVEEWVNSNWPGSPSRNSFNAEWLINKWSEDKKSPEFDVLEEANADLMFQFGYSKYEFDRAAKSLGIPVFTVMKES